MEWLGYASWALIPIVALIAWGAIGVTRAMKSGGGDPHANDAIARRLDAIDARLAAVEKTLNDIP